MAILWMVKNGTKKPIHIMYDMNLSWKTLQRILKSLASQGLVREIDLSDRLDERTKKCYEIIRKGEKVVRYF